MMAVARQRFPAAAALSRHFGGGVGAGAAAKHWTSSVQAAIHLQLI